MTDEERKILYYLPSPRDPELEDGEYYVADTAGRVHKVFITDLLPHEESIEYGVIEVGTEKRIHPWYGDKWRGFGMRDLYDNRDDCKNMEHPILDDWEHLRRIQMTKYPYIYERGGDT